jgi:hypothetical protein
MTRTKKVQCYSMLREIPSLNGVSFELEVKFNDACTSLKPSSRFLAAI